MTTLTFDVLWRDRGAQRGMQQLGDTTEKTGRRFTALKATAAAALAAAAVGAVKFGGASVRAYVEAETAQGKLQDAYRRFPRLADTQIGALQRLNTELARKTRFDDDATASGQAVLAQFKLTGTQIQQLTPLLQDYAARTGKSLPDAAKALGRSFLGNTRALKEVGINYKATGDTTRDFENITRLLRTQVGGFAEKEGKTAAGQAEILKNQFGELQEEAGSRLLPALMKIGRGLLSVVTYVQDSNGVFGSFRRIASATFSAFTESVGAGKASFKGFADFLSTHQEDITRGFVVGGKVVLGFASVLATMASGGLRALGSLMDGFGNMTGVVLGTLRNLTKGAAIAFGWIPGVGEKLRDADATFKRFADTATAGFRKAGDGARGAANGIDTKLRPALTAAGKKLDEVGNKEIWKARQRDAANRARIQIDAIGTAANGSQLKLKTWNARTELGSDAQRELEGRIRTARQRLIEQMRAGIQAGDSQARLTTRWNQGRQALEREFRQMGLSREEARRLAIRYAAIPKKAETKVTQPGMGTAKNDTKRLADLIREIPNSKKVTITFTAKSFVGADGIKYRVNTSSPSSVGRSGPAMVFGGQPLGLDEHGQPTTNILSGPGSKGGGPGDPKRSKIIVNTARLPANARRQPGEIRDMITGYEQGIGNALGRAVRANVGMSDSGAPGGRVGTRNVGAGWGPIQAAMRRHGATTFNTYPGHHPSMARARDVYPHNWAAANAARALSSVWYVIYRMKIASKNHGNTWRPYRPTNFRGDWRHVRHIHVARYDKGGYLPRGVSLAVNNTGKPERVVSGNDDQIAQLIAAIREHGLQGPTFNFDIDNPVAEKSSQTANRMLQRVAALPLV